MFSKKVFQCGIPAEDRLTNFPDYVTLDQLVFGQSAHSSG
jgi:hypothetical protein